MLLVPVAVWADGWGQRRSYEIDRQAFQWRDDNSTTSSEEWRALPMVREGSEAIQPAAEPLDFIARGPMSVTFSGDFAGAPVQIRVIERQKAYRPGRATFDPTPWDSSKSFTFVSGGSDEARCLALFVQWRSPTGGEVTFRRGDVVVTYNRPQSTDARCPNV